MMAESPAGPTDASAAARAGEAQYRLLVESVEDYAILMLDPEGRVTSWNAGAERIKGYTAAEVLGKHFSIFFSEEDRESGRPDRLLESVAREGRYEDQGWRVRKDGSRFWANALTTALRDSDGALVGFAKVTRDLTERRESEEALRRSEERFRQLAENAREVFWLYEPDFHRPLYVSPAFETVWGRSVESILDEPLAWLEAVHEDDRERLAGFAEATKRGEATVEYRIVRPDGTVRWLWTRGFPVRDEHGEVTRIGGVTEDVTEERESEERLKFLAETGRVLSSSLEYRETLRNVARLAVPHIADWCVVDVLENGVIHRMGVSHVDPAKEALAWEVAERYPPDPGAPSGVAEAIRTGEPQLATEISEETLRQAAKDEEHYRLLCALGLRSFIILPMVARGRTLGTITLIGAESGRRFTADDVRFVEQIARRSALAVDNARLYRSAEDALGEAERRAKEEAALRRAAEAVTASLTIDQVTNDIAQNALQATDADGAFVERLDAAGEEVEVVAVAGSVVPALGGRLPYRGSYAELVIESSETLLVPSIQAARRPVPHGIAESCENCSAMIVPLIDEGEAIGTLVLTRLPERGGFREQETERARTFADLASLAFRKIHLLQESERRREELESLMESRARLIRGFSHDLKNPLGAADGYLELIESGVFTDPEKRELSVARARRAIHSALSLIQDLSELARVEAGQIDVRLQPVDVRRLVTEMVEDYRAQAEARGLELECALPPELPIVQSDAGRIGQILGNLISNGVKYTPAGRVRVRAEAGRPGPRPGEWVSVEVEDTGIGIAEDQQHLLFREFTRLSPSNTPGAGLGLAISQRVAEALSGCITVRSEAGRGSVFTLWLPCGEGRG